MMCLGVARVECDRAFERGLRALEGSRVADSQQRRPRHPGVRRIGVVLQRTVVSGKAAGQEALWWRVSVIPGERRAEERRVATGNPRQRGREFGVDLNRCLIFLDGPGN